MFHTYIKLFTQSCVYKFDKQHVCFKLTFPFYRILKEVHEECGGEASSDEDGELAAGMQHEQLNSCHSPLLSIPDGIKLNLN